MTGKRLILVEDDPLIALDLKQIVGICMPGYAIEQYDALDAIPSAAGPACVLIYKTQSDPEAARADLDRVRMSATHVIAISDVLDPEQNQDACVRVVMQPFSQSAIEQALGSLKPT